MDTDNAYDPYLADFEIGSATDTGFDAQDDAADFEMVCNECGEPHARKRASKHVPGLCCVCCPVRRAEFAAELLADEGE